MNLPNADPAVVEIAKLRDYCLNPALKERFIQLLCFVSRRSHENRDQIA